MPISFWDERTKCESLQLEAAKVRHQLENHSEANEELERIRLRYPGNRGPS
jgi:hypothetical protein